MNELNELLDSVRAKIADQGNIVDDRLLEKERQLVAAIGSDVFEDFESSDLDAEPTSTGNSKFAKTQQHPCEHCGGTGEYRGVRIHEQRSHCFACKGKGYFMTSFADRQKARRQRLERKERKEQASIDAWVEKHPELYEFLKGASWSEFACQLLGNVRKYGSLTPKQLDAAVRMMEKCAERERAKAEARAKNAELNKLDINLDRLFDLFANATGSGLKRPRLVIDSLSISRAPDSGRNAGCLYLKWNGDYVGKVNDAPELMLQRWAEQGEDPKAERIREILGKLADDPLGYAQLYGQRTGVCCCCNRELTDPKSIELGIGPVCITKWGL